MSLRIWLPLNGDLKNNGINQYEITTINTISWVNGKIGKAVQIGNGNQVTNGISINSNLEDILVGNYSISVWIKPLGNHVHYNGAIISSGDWNNTSAHSKWSFGVSQDNTKVDVLCTGYNTYLNCSCPVNEWTHLACVYNGTNVVKLYKNGEYVGQYQNNNFPTQRPTSSASNTTIGRETYANGYFSFNGCINDLRIYDHALSEKEIKKISQGLILHYALNRSGFGQENLLSGNNAKILTWTNYMPNSVILSGNGYDNKYTLIKGIGGWEKIFTEPITVTSGDTYTLSFIYSVEQDYVGYSGQFGLSVCSTSQNKYGNDTDVITKFNFGLTKKDKTKASITFTPNSNTIYLVANGGCINDGQENISFYISYLKLEKGEKATPWCPNSADTEYTTLGLNDNIEYDLSGYNRNAIRTNGITHNTDTPKYNVNSTFNGSDVIKAEALPASASTISFWLKVSTIPSSIMAIFADSHDDDASNMGLGFYNSNMFFLGTKKTSVFKDFTGIFMKDQWNHLVIIKDNDTTYRIYCNGELLPNGNTSTYMDHHTDELWIGNRDYNNRYLNGQMSDFRVYATALSQADIAELYSIHRS